jgi:hypothetical protein
MEARAGSVAPRSLTGIRVIELADEQAECGLTLAGLGPT